MSNYERSLKKSKEPSGIGNPNHHQSIHECTIDIQKKIQVSINTPDLCEMFWQNWDFFNYLIFITKDLLKRLLGSLKLQYHFLVIYYWSTVQYFGIFNLLGVMVKIQGLQKLSSGSNPTHGFKCKMFIFDLYVHARALGWIVTDLLIYLE